VIPLQDLICLLYPTPFPKEEGDSSASPEDTSYIYITSIFQRPLTPSQELTEMKESAP